MDSSPPDSSVSGIIQARIMEWIAFPSPGDLPDPGIEPRSPTMQADSLPAEPPGKPKNTSRSDLPNPRTELGFPALQVNSLQVELLVQFRSISQ